MASFSIYHLAEMGIAGSRAVIIATSGGYGLW
jgi:hypothetical protein